MQVKHIPHITPLASHLHACLRKQIRVLQYDPDQERLLSIASYRHAPEVWSIAPSAADEDLMITVWGKGVDLRNTSSGS